MGRECQQGLRQLSQEKLKENSSYVGVSVLSQVNFFAWRRKEQAAPIMGPSMSANHNKD